MAREAVISLDVSQIHNRFDVRKKLDDDRILYLAELIDAGEKLPPIRVCLDSDGAYSFVDGRHRAAAHVFMNILTIDAVVEKSNDQAYLFGQALHSNYGGAKPPTRDDINHTIRRMLESGIGIKAIKEQLAFMPMAQIRNAIKQAELALNKAKIRYALDAIAREGLRPVEAAARYKVEQSALEDVIAGRKRKFGKATGDQLFMTTKAYIHTSLKSAFTGIQKKMENMQRMVEDGEVDVDTAVRLVQDWQDYHQRWNHRVRDWLERFQQLQPPEEGK